jgi:transcriptional regulator with XRE-family HTH domain
MNIIKRRQKIIEDLKDKEYRDAFVTEHINTGVPFQIRALREQKGREWTQKELGIRTGMAQETISRVEDPNYGKLTLKTLKRLASAFDVALMVRFIPFSELVEWELHLAPDSLKALSFEDESYFKEERKEELINLPMEQEQHSLGDSNVIYIYSWKQEREVGTQKTLIDKRQFRQHPTNTVQEQYDYETSIR